MIQELLFLPKKKIKQSQVFFDPELLNDYK